MQDLFNFLVIFFYKDIKFFDYNLNNFFLIQDYNVNMLGGNDKGIYYVGLGYNKLEGFFIFFFYECYSFIFNGSYKLVDWIIVSFNFNYNCVNWCFMFGL